MLILKAAPGDAAGETRLAAAMLNFEHGARAYTSEGEALCPGSGEPWPTVEIPPVTAHGVASRVHYRPTVAIVYYTPHLDLDIGALFRRLRVILNTQATTHIAASRTIAATASLVIRQTQPNLLEGTAMIAGTRKSFRKRAISASPWASRMMLSAPSDDPPPHHYSVRAGFTWVFMPICSALSVKSTKNVAAEANAIIASVAYDVAGMLRLDDGAEVYRHITDADFTFAETPTTFIPPAWIAQFAAGCESALLVDVRAGTATHVGRAAYLGAAPRELPKVARPPPDAGPAQCCNCNAPVVGIAARLRRLPPTGQHELRDPQRDWDINQKDPLNLPICQHCWNALEENCVVSHINLREIEVALFASPADWPLRGARLAPVPGVPGAFTVTPPGGTKPTLIIAGENCGKYPYATVPGLAAMRLPVIGGLRIAEIS